MSGFFTCIVTKPGRALWNVGGFLKKKDADHHEEIIDKYGLKDTSIANRTWVRVEMWPKGDLGDLWEDFDQEDWEFAVDEPSTVEWITDKHEKAAREALEQCIKSITKRRIMRRRKASPNTHFVVVSTLTPLYFTTTVSASNMTSSTWI